MPSTFAKIMVSYKNAVVPIFGEFWGVVGKN
jgi:hypothetical protein